MEGLRQSATFARQIACSGKNAGRDPLDGKTVKSIAEPTLDLGVHPGDLRRPRGVVAADHEDAIDQFNWPGRAIEPWADDLTPSTVQIDERLYWRSPHLRQEAFEGALDAFGFSQDRSSSLLRGDLRDVPRPGPERYRAAVPVRS